MNWFPVGKVGANKTYASKNECESTEGQACFDITSIDPRDYDVVEVDGIPSLQLNAVRQAARLEAEAYSARISERIAKHGKALRVIALMGIRNEDKGLTTEQVQTFLTTYQPIMLMLLSLSIPTARAMIDAITPDGVITTAEDKAAILAEIDA